MMNSKHWAWIVISLAVLQITLPTWRAHAGPVDDCIRVALNQKLRAEALQKVVEELPDPLFGAVFSSQSVGNRPQFLMGFTEFVTDSPQPGKSVRTLYSYGQRFTSNLIAEGDDVFIEGYYRNLRYLAEPGATPPPPVWMRWDKPSGKYVLESKGAEKRLLQAFLKSPEAAAARTPTGDLKLFHGGSETSQKELLEIQRLLKNPLTREDAVKKAKAFAASSKHGIFTTYDMAIAGNYAQPALLEIQISPKDLQNLVDQDQLYAGYEYSYFEFAFQTPEAILALAKGLVTHKH